MQNISDMSRGLSIVHVWSHLMFSFMDSFDIGELSER